FSLQYTALPFLPFFWFLLLLGLPFPSALRRALPLPLLLGPPARDGTRARANGSAGSRISSDRPHDGACRRSFGRALHRGAGCGRVDLGRGRVPCGLGVGSRLARLHARLARSPLHTPHLLRLFLPP